MQYFAYGSNMNTSEMQQRCPQSTPARKYQLSGFRLVFKYYADIAPAEGCTVHGGLWQITQDCEASLDRYEGYPSFYGKYYQDGIMFYRMQETYRDYESPAIWYLKTVIQGYKDFGLTQNDFEESLGVQHLGLTQTAVEERLGVSAAELERLFSPTAPRFTD